jgi:hypothetical protein
MLKIILSVIMILGFCINTSLYAETPSAAVMSNHWLRIATEETDLQNKVRILRRAIILNEKNYKALQELGLVYMKIGEKELGQDFLELAANVYNQRTETDTIVREVITRERFINNKIGNIDYITIMTEDYKPTEKESKPTHIINDQIFLSLYPADYSDEIYSDNNEVKYFLVITNLSYEPINLVDISSVREECINVNIFTIDNVLTTDFNELQIEYNNLDIEAYQTVIIGLVAKGLNKGQQKLSVELVYEDIAGNRESKFTIKEVVIK